MKVEVDHVEKEGVSALLLRIRAGEHTAFDALLGHYQPLLYSEVNRKCEGLSHEDVEDLHQVALLALYRAAMNFDLTQSEVEFGLYAKVCISHAVVSQLRVLRRHTGVISLAEVDESASVAEDPSRRLVDEEAFAALHARIRAVLSPYEWRVWTLYTAGYRSGEIARLLDKPSHSVENAVYRIRQKLRVALGRDR